MKTLSYLLVFVFLLSIGCSGTQSGKGLVVEDQPPISNALELIHRAEDRRTLFPILETFVDQTDQTIRLQLAVAVGRIGDPNGAAILVSLLSDPDPKVRQAAYFASGGFGIMPETLKEKLVQRLAVEDRINGILAIIDALSRSATPGDLALLGRLVDDNRPEVRARALQAIGFGAMRSLPVSKKVATNMAAYLTDKSEDVRLMSAFALREIDQIQPSAAILETLAKSGTGDPSAEVRILAVEALAVLGGLEKSVLDRVLRDSDYRVTAAAVQSLTRIDGPSTYQLVERTMETVATGLHENEELAGQAYAHVIRSALEAAIRFRGATKIKAHAVRIAEKVASLETPRSAGEARILCLARLVAGRNNLALLSCDPSRPENGKRVVMQSLYRGANTPDENLKILGEMVADANLQVAVTAIAFLGRIDRPGAKNAVLNALRDERTLVVTAALDTITHAPKLFLNLSGTGKNKALIQAIGAVVNRYGPFEHAHAPLVSAARALQAIGDPSGKPILVRLGADPRPGVRHAVLAAFDGMKNTTPPAGLAPLAPTRPFPYSEKITVQTTKTRVVIMTSRGGLSISLNATAAPGAVENFLRLADSTYFNLTPVHRVVPGAVVQAGDPTGTGLGDPGYSLRGEPGQIPFRRGTVGMAQSQKDTAGSQFFITLSRQPNFDGTYTVLGQVTSGMETVDLLEEGDIIEEVMIQRR